MLRAVASWEGQRGHRTGSEALTAPPDCAVLGFVLPTADGKEEASVLGPGSFREDVAWGSWRSPRAPLSHCRGSLLQALGGSPVLGSVRLSVSGLTGAVLLFVIPAVSLSRCPVPQRPLRDVPPSCDPRCQRWHRPRGHEATGRGGEGKGTKPAVLPLRVQCWFVTSAHVLVSSVLP